MEQVNNLRVLWFSNTPAGYEQYEKGNNIHKPATGTWMAAIANKILDYQNIELGIAFYSTQKKSKITNKNITYFPIFNSELNTRIGRLIYKYKGGIVNGDYIAEYLRIIKEFKPNVIHVFGSEGPFGLIAQHTKIPVVLSIQGNLTVYEYKYFSGIPKNILFSVDTLYNRLKYSHYKAIFNSFQKKAQRERLILKDIKHIIGRTDWDRRIASVLAPKAKYYYNDELLREEFYQAQAVKPVLKDTIRITTMSGPAVYKGLETICKAALLLQNHGLKFEWFVTGISEDERLVKSVKKLLGNEFPKNVVQFKGRVNALEFIDFLTQTNIYVMPSHIENSPLSLSEAMIMAIPTISTLAGGTGSRLADKKEGLLIQDGDPWSMSGAILELLRDYEKAIDYGVNARKRALKRHDSGRIISDLIKIYNKIIKCDAK